MSEHVRDAQIRDVVIVGASVAGVSAADALRDGGFEGTITMLSDERHIPYDRPPLSKAMLSTGGDGAPSQPLRPGDIDHFATNGIDLRLGHGAAGLDIDRHYVITTDGDPLPYDAVVIATGSRPRKVVTDKGYALPTLRTVDDLAGIRGAIERHGEITLVGAGFIGLESAASLRARGIDVTVVGAESLPLAPSIGDDIAEHIRDLHVEHGVRFLLGVAVTGVSGTEGALTISFEDGTVHETPFAIAGIGVTPNTEWLVGSGVELENGILCDASGRTSVPGIYAAGDVANIDVPSNAMRRPAGHWTSAVEQGRHVAGEILTSRGEPFDVVPYFWTDQYDRKLQVYGHRGATDTMVVAEGSIDSGEFLALFGDGEAFHAVATIGRGASLRAYRRLLREHATWHAALAAAGID